MHKIRFQTPYFPKRFLARVKGTWNQSFELKITPNIMFLLKILAKYHPYEAVLVNNDILPTFSRVSSVDSMSSQLSCLDFMNLPFNMFPVQFIIYWSIPKPFRPPVLKIFSRYRNQEGAVSTGGAVSTDLIFLKHIVSDRDFQFLKCFLLSCRLWEWIPL